MKKVILLVSFLSTIMPLFGAERIVKPEGLGAYAGIQAFSKQPAVIKPSLINKITADITHPEKLHFPMTFDDRLATDGMLIFLDDSEEKLETVSVDLLFALTQKACPILASTHLLQAIEKTLTVGQYTTSLDKLQAEKVRKYLDYLKTSIPFFIEHNPTLSKKEVINKINLSLRARANQLDIEHGGIPIKDYQNSIRSSLIKEFTPWNQNEWIIKAVDKELQLLLLIPKDYIFKNKSEVPSESIFLPKSAPLTPLEYKTGLKIDHMQTMNNYRAMIMNVPSNTAPDTHFMNPILKTDIFVSRAEYAAAPLLYEQPRWALYMNGHGLKNEFICGLSISAFSRFLEFLDTRINTALFCYASCYTVGTNQKLIYKDLERPWRLSFPIATAGAFDDTAATSLTIPFIKVDYKTVDFTNKKLLVDFSIDFKQFIEKSTSRHPTIADVASPVMPSYRLGQLSPHIRLGNSEWFTIDNADNNIATIGTPFAQTCEKIDLEKKFTKKGITPAFYCLYTSIIPCELIIRSSNIIPIFFPMAPLKNSQQSAFMYYIKKLSTHHFSLPDIHAMCTTSTSNHYKLTVFFDEIELHEIAPTTRLQKISNVLLSRDLPNKDSIFFTDENSNKFYEMDFKKHPLEANEVPDYRHLKQELGLTDAIAQFEKEKRKPIKALETTLKKKIELGDQYGYSKFASPIQ